MRVLIVEDNDLKRDKAISILKKLGIKEILTEKYVSRVLQRIDILNPDLIITDLGLPRFIDSMRVEDYLEGLKMLYDLTYMNKRIPTIIFSETLIPEEKIEYLSYLKYPYFGQAKKVDELSCLIDKFIKRDDTTVYFCIENEFDTDYLKEERGFAKKTGIGIWYKRDDDAFYNFDNEKIDISGKRVLVRTGIEQISEINKAVEGHGGILVLNDEDYKRVINYLDYYQPKRKIRKVLGRDLINKDNLKKIEDEFGKCFFFKTVDKDFSYVLDSEVFKNEKCVFYQAFLNHLDEEFIISEVIDIDRDELGLKEYRTFVFDGEVQNISRITNEVMHSVDERVYGKANSILNNIGDEFPRYFVMDLCEYNNGEIDVVEFNPFGTSGPYLYNSIFPQDIDLLHQDKGIIPYERKDKLSSLKTEGNIIDIRSNLYEKPGTLANDIILVHLFGSVGGCLSYFNLESEPDMNLFKSLVPDKPSMTLIESDEDLFGSTSASLPDELDENLKKLLLNELSKINR